MLCVRDGEEQPGAMVQVGSVEYELISRTSARRKEATALILDCSTPVAKSRVVSSVRYFSMHESMLTVRSGWCLLLDLDGG